MQFELNAKVKAFSGDYIGYYGEILELSETEARVSHQPFEGGFAGYWIALADLEPNE